MPVFELDDSWLAACLRLDQRVLNGLWTKQQWQRELRICFVWSIDGRRQRWHELGCCLVWLIDY